jgi:hypothetical protein
VVKVEVTPPAVKLVPEKSPSTVRALAGSMEAACCDPCDAAGAAEWQDAQAAEPT